MPGNLSRRTRDLGNKPISTPTETKANVVSRLSCAQRCFLCCLCLKQPIRACSRNALPQTQFDACAPRSSVERQSPVEISDCRPRDAEKCGAFARGDGQTAGVATATK